MEPKISFWWFFFTYWNPWSTPKFDLCENSLGLEEMLQKRQWNMPFSGTGYSTLPHFSGTLQWKRIQHTAPSQWCLPVEQDTAHFSTPVSFNILLINATKRMRGGDSDYWKLYGPKEFYVHPALQWDQHVRRLDWENSEIGTCLTWNFF